MAGEPVGRRVGMPELDVLGTMKVVTEVGAKVVDCNSGRTVGADGNNVDGEAKRGIIRISSRLCARREAQTSVPSWLPSGVKYTKSRYSPPITNGRVVRAMNTRVVTVSACAVSGSV